MKSLICPSCGCIAHIQDHQEEIKDRAICEMCGSSPYLYDEEIEPFAFPGQGNPSTRSAEKPEKVSEES